MFIKGYKPTKESLKNLSKSLKKGFIKGRVVWNKGSKGKQIAWNKGIRKRITKNCLVCNKDYQIIFYRVNKSKYCSIKCRGIGNIQKGKSRLYNRGNKNPNWRGGVTSIHEAIRKSLEYEEWRKVVFERDNYTCQYCGEIGGKLNADHIKPFSLYPDLRFDINNGRTLCENCHFKIGWNLFKENNPKVRNL